MRCHGNRITERLLKTIFICGGRGGGGGGEGGGGWKHVIKVAPNNGNLWTVKTYFCSCR